METGDLICIWEFMGYMFLVHVRRKTYHLNAHVSSIHFRALK